MDARRGRPPHPDPVTPAELRVLELVREGLTNAEIAVRLRISVNTVRYHVSNLLSKANATDRAELRAWRPAAHPGSQSARWGWLALLLKPQAAAVAGLSVAAVAGAGLLLNAAYREPTREQFEDEPAGPFQGAVVGDLIRQGAGLAVIERATGEGFALTESMNFDRHVGAYVFILGTIEGNQITPAGGSLVGSRSRCAGVLLESEGTHSVAGGCGGMEIVGLSLDQLIAMRSERVMVSVTACTVSTGGRLASPPISLYDDPVPVSC